MSVENYSCQKCGKGFETERGLKTHKGRMHDPLPREKAVKLYIYENLSARAIADQLDISHRNIKDRLSKYDLWGKDPCKFYLEDDQGYPTMRRTGDQDNRRIRVHRLVAVAKGYDPHKVFSGDFDVDHINNCKLDNRPENIQLLNKREHGEKHAHQGPKNQYDS